MLNRSQRNFAHVTTVILSWRGQTLVENVLNQSTANFGRIYNSIEIALVGRAPDQAIDRYPWRAWTTDSDILRDNIPTA